MIRPRSRRRVHDYEDLATALRYDGKGAPRVIAKGQDELARKIIDLGRDNGVPIVASPDIVEMLASVPLDDEIPQNLFVAVAEVLAFAYSLTGRELPAREASSPAPGRQLARGAHAPRRPPRQVPARIE